MSCIADPGNSATGIPGALWRSARDLMRLRGPVEGGSDQQAAHSRRLRLPADAAGIRGTGAHRIHEHE